ncbi:nucleotidyl transferase AbiEii/AbiGii toxin family protein [Paraburkholderia phenazinium]|uniref:Predicted nucleotidyltransferase n=1 Tax=Paraburkholderia phenazinium TaxID=60549 RepID=A0A1G8N681_9BURK|nr:nucleotidyl transferase AbiEii/AbiGii toxin family protein [Paraburkholderia phenazinium]SDI75712.1 Predicted nucleotidyltransferase [Paraburkholderia phenazinium]
MTPASPHFNLKVSEDRPLHPVTIALLGHVRDAAQQMGADFVVAGATARDIVLWHVYGIRAERATRDVDVAVCAISWTAHRELIARLEATGFFKADAKAEQSLTFEDTAVGKSAPLDLVPFGPLEAPEGTITWPKGEFAMNVLGFQEAVATALQIEIGEGLVVPVVSLPALALLKILAWRDRRTSKNTDASDLLLVLRNYHEAGNEERIWESATDLLDAYGFDLDLAAAALLGRDARQLALPTTLATVLQLLADEGTYDLLRRDMFARAVVQIFADDSDKTLAAFRDALLSPPQGQL